MARLLRPLPVRASRQVPEVETLKMALDSMRRCLTLTCQRPPWLSVDNSMLSSHARRLSLCPEVAGTAVWIPRAFSRSRRSSGALWIGSGTKRTERFLSCSCSSSWGHSLA